MIKNDYYETKLKVFLYHNNQCNKQSQLEFQVKHQL